VSLSTKILIGLLLGIAVGVFFGEASAPLQLLGDIYIGLMQMSVTPYIVLSLIYGIGRLNPLEAKRVAGRGAAIVLGIWVLGVLSVLAMPLAFPDLVSSAYYSGPAEVKETSAQTFLDLFIPSNIVRSLSEDLIPGVILFCVCVGALLMRRERKEEILSILKTGLDIIEALASAVAQLTPVGVFGMAAATAGTMTAKELTRLQVYAVVYVAACLFLALWVLPAAIRSVLPIKWQRLMTHLRSPLLIAFTTTSTFVALPLISERVRRILKENSAGGEELEATHASYTDVLLPIVYAMPTIGGIIDLFFLEFTGWSYGTPLSAAASAKLAVVGIPALFSEAAAIPFLLRQLHLPSDAYNLYLMSGIFTGYFACMLAAMCLATTVLVGVAWATGQLRPRKVAAGWAFASTAIAGLLFLLGLRAVLTLTTREDAPPVPAIMALRVEEPVAAKVLRAGESPPHAEPVAPAGELLRDILRRRVIRVGYIPASMPWSYFNDQGELIGYDIEMAHRLARDMNTSLEFIPIDFARWTEDLEARRYDIAMVAFSISPERIDQVDFTAGHRSLPAVFVVQDYRKAEFNTRQQLQRMPKLRLAVLQTTMRYKLAAKEFPQATIVPLQRPEDFFKEGEAVADAWYTEAGKGYAYALLHPAFDAVDDSAGPSVGEAYPIPRGERTWQTYANAFLATQNSNGFEQFLYEKYVLGKHPAVREPRWSIGRNVLHWID
jgi:Na+/H+-dicarboxylate symporter/ABC-type amino acid transport substrate-binding protein